MTKSIASMMNYDCTEAGFQRFRKAFVKNAIFEGLKKSADDTANQLTPAQQAPELQDFCKAILALPGIGSFSIRHIPTENKTELYIGSEDLGYDVELHILFDKQEVIGYVLADDDGNMDATPLKNWDALVKYLRDEYVSTDRIYQSFDKIPVAQLLTFLNRELNRVVDPVTSVFEDSDDEYVEPQHDDVIKIMATNAYKAGLANLLLTKDQLDAITNYFISLGYNSVDATTGFMFLSLYQVNQ
jgi:hypothetical protein